MKLLNMILVLCIIVSSSAVVAKDKPSKEENMIKFRQSAMMFMRWNVGKIKKQVIKNPALYNKEDVEEAANAIAAVANSGIDRLFTTKSATGKGWKATRVKPVYFQQSEKVKQRHDTFRNEANKLAIIAGRGNINNIGFQFGKLFASCQGCHKSYREKK